MLLFSGIISDARQLVSDLGAKLCVSDSPCRFLELLELGLGQRKERSSTLLFYTVEHRAPSMFATK